MKSLLLLVLCSMFIDQLALSQSVKKLPASVPVLNQPCPDFVFDTLLNYKNEKLRMGELKGKYVILDFWGTFCVPCIRDFPKLETIQKRLKDSLQILLVATDGIEKAGRFYRSREEKGQPMFLPCAVKRQASRYFGIKEVSTYIWIDNQGVVRAMTDASQLTEENVVDFVNGKLPKWRQFEPRGNIDFKKGLVATANEIDSSTLIFKSSLTKYLNGFSGSYHPPRNGIGTEVHGTNITIRHLYQIAYADSLGTVPVNRVLIESIDADKIAFPRDKGLDINEWSVHNNYCYELTVPKEREKDILKFMRDDLSKLFGYKAFWEKRKVKCLALVGKGNDKLWADTAQVPKQQWAAGGVAVTNQPFQLFFGMIKHYNQLKLMLDETGIKNKVSVSLNARMDDLQELNKDLEQYGLQLKEVERLLPMLVIQDPAKR